MSKMARQAKIQSLVIKHLKTHGELDLLLPDGITLEIGITYEDKHGNLIKSDDYCYVNAFKDDRKILLDSYEMGLLFSENSGKIVLEDQYEDDLGNLIHSVDIV